jgi:hypothetical protein
MPAKSKQQQKFFGVVKAMQKGDIPKKGEAGDVADDMTKKDVDKMASTKHKGLPKKIKEMIDEEIHALNEVQPFVDNKLRNTWEYPKGDKNGLVYLATNDKRYPTEIVLYNMIRDVFHFVYSYNGEFTKGNTKTQTVPRKGFNSTHYVMPYFEEWEEDFDYERGFYEAKLPDEGFSDPDQMRELRRVKRLDIKIGNKINIARAKSHFKKGEKIAAIDKRTGEIIPITGLNQFGGLPSRRYEYGYIVEAKMTPAKVQKAQRELVATIQLLKKNFPMYKAAKESGDEKKLAKHRDIAVKLTKKKKQLELDLDRALGGLYQDAELELKEGKLTEGPMNDPALKSLRIKSKGELMPKLSQWWEYDPDDVMRFVYWGKGMLPPHDEKIREREWANIVKQLHVKYPIPADAKGMVDPSEGINEALPKFKSPLEALKWVWAKRDEAMDMEQELKDISADIQQLHGEMEQEAEPGGGPIADKYGEELKALEDHHKQVRAEYNQLMAEIDEYDQNYM